MFQRLSIIVFLFLVTNTALLYSQEASGGFDFSKIDQFDKATGLPKLYFGGGFVAGKYRETDYSHMLYGFNMFVGLPVDKVLSAECYAEFHFHNPNATGSDFWRREYGLRSSTTVTLGGFRILSAGGRLRFLLFRHWEWLIGGGIGAWGFNAIVNDVDYGRYTVNIYEVELSTGYSHSISEKWSINARVTMKKYFLEDADRHSLSCVFGISAAYKWFRK